jgi:hypothetical protein
MNENNKSFYPSYMFEFIHHPKYGCRNLKGLTWKVKEKDNIIESNAAKENRDKLTSLSLNQCFFLRGISPHPMEVAVADLNKSGGTNPIKVVYLKP